MYCDMTKEFPMSCCVTCKSCWRDDSGKSAKCRITWGSVDWEVTACRYYKHDGLHETREYFEKEERFKELFRDLDENTLKGVC